MFKLTERYVVICQVQVSQWLIHGIYAYKIISCWIRGEQENSGFYLYKGRNTSKTHQHMINVHPALQNLPALLAFIQGSEEIMLFLCSNITELSRSVRPLIK